MIENQGYIPGPFTCHDYLNVANPLRVTGSAIVSGSFQKFDQTYLVNAVQTLGKNYVGVTQSPYHTPDDEIITLNNLGLSKAGFGKKR